jgi:hypothetical protein
VSGRNGTPREGNALVGLTGDLMSPDDSLDRWTHDLRGHLARGDLAGLGAFDIGDGTMCLPGEITVRIMLADLVDLDNPEGSWGGDAAWREERRRELRRNFRRLRELLG